LNGIDTESYDPAADPTLPTCFDAEDPSGRTACKLALQTAMGLKPDPFTPVAGMVSRLDPQKGIDLLVEVMDRAVGEFGVQFALLGSGAPQYQEALRRLAER